MGDGKDEAQDGKISDNRNAITVLSGRFDGFEALALERHETIKGTMETSTNAIDLMRSEASDRAKAAEKRRHKAEALVIAEKAEAKRKTEEHELEASKFWRNLAGNWRAWAAAVALVFAITSPTSVPLMIHYVGQLASLKPPNEAIAAEIVTVQPTASTAAPE